MVEKLVIDEQKDDKQTLRELVAKVNELVDAVGSVCKSPLELRTRRVPDKTAHVRFMETMCQRLQSGSMMYLYQVEPNELTKEIRTALTALQTTIQEYKKSLEVPNES